MLRTRIAVARLHSRVPIHTHADGLRRRLSEGGLRVFDSLRGCHFAVEAHRDVQRIGNAQAAGANPALGSRYALQALRAEHRIRNPEVDRAIRSWGTSRGSLTQRDRDPPFKRSDPGAIPGRPTICPSRTDSGASALYAEGVRCKSSVGLQSRRVKQAGSCTRLLTDGCHHAAWPSSGPLSANIEARMWRAQPA